MTEHLGFLFTLVIKHPSMHLDDAELLKQMEARAVGCTCFSKHRVPTLLRGLADQIEERNRAGSN